MIQWLTTVAPSTTASSSFSQSDSFSTNAPRGTGFLASSLSSSESFSQSASWNWSRTSSASGSSSAFSLGRTFFPEENSNPQTIEADGSNFATATPTTLSLTNSRYLQTSTTVSATYLVQGGDLPDTTGSETYEATQWTTATLAVSEKTVTEFVAVSAESSRMIVVTRPTTSSEATVATVLTATTATELDPNFYATVYQANDTNEVLWFLDSSTTNPFDGDYSAASELASTVTRTTAMPWTKTTQVTVVNSSDPLTSFTGTAISSVFSLATESFVESQMTVTSGTVALGIGTTETPFNNFEQAQTTSSITFINLPLFNSCASTESITVWFMSSQPATAYASIVSAGATNTFETLFPVATSTTHRTTYTHLPTGSTQSGDSASGISRASQIYASKPLALATFMQDSPQDSTVGPQGVMDAEGSVALYYSSPVTIEFVYEEGIETYLPHLWETTIRLNVSQSRGIGTLYPSAYSFFNNAQDITGVMSVSGLSISATSANTIESEISQTTTSFVVEPAGQTNIGYFFNSTLQLTNVHGGNLGEFESAFFTMHPGVYRFYNSDGSESTASNTGAISSWTGTREISSVRHLSCLVPSFAPMSPLVWTATRNNHFFRSGYSTAYAP
jgi:trimeric autotransporter adhesin